MERHTHFVALFYCKLWYCKGGQNSRFNAGLVLHGRDGNGKGEQRLQEAVSSKRARGKHASAANKM